MAQLNIKSLNFFQRIYENYIKQHFNQHILEIKYEDEDDYKINPFFAMTVMYYTRNTNMYYLLPIIAPIELLFALIFWLILIPVVIIPLITEVLVASITTVLIIFLIVVIFTILNFLMCCYPFGKCMKNFINEKFNCRKYLQLGNNDDNYENDEDNENNNFIDEVKWWHIHFILFILPFIGSIFILVPIAIIVSILTEFYMIWLFIFVAWIGLVIIPIGTGAICISCQDD